MNDITFNTVWERIIYNQGQVFYTVTGLKFTYSIEGDYLITDRTKYKLPKTDFARAFERMPIPSPSCISKIVRGPSYIWAILNDHRISKEDW